MIGAGFGSVLWVGATERRTNKLVADVSMKIPYLTPSLIPPDVLAKLKAEATEALIDKLVELHTQRATARPGRPPDLQRLKTIYQKAFELGPLGLSMRGGEYSRLVTEVCARLGDTSDANRRRVHSAVAPLRIDYLLNGKRVRTPRTRGARRPRKP